MPSTLEAGAGCPRAAARPTTAWTTLQVSIEDFAPYLRTVGSKLDEFERDRAASEHRLEQALTPEELAASQGQGLVAALAEVPQEFFQENIDADRSMLWSALGDVTSEEPRQEALDRLSHFLVGSRSSRERGWLACGTSSVITCTASLTVVPVRVIT